MQLMMDRLFKCRGVKLVFLSFALSLRIVTAQRLIASYLKLRHLFLIPTGAIVWLPVQKLSCRIKLRDY